MSTADFRAAVAASVRDWAAANFPAVPVFYENGPTADEAAVGAVWVELELRFYGGEFANVGVNARQRQTGAVALRVYAKDATGTALPDQLCDSAGNLLAGKSLGGAILWAPQRLVPTKLLGWYKTGILVPFTLG